MEHVKVSRRLAAPPERVWAVYADHARWSEWSGLPGSHLVKPGIQGRNGAGAVRGFAGGVREKVVEFDPPRRMTYTIVAGPMPVRDYLAEVTLEPDGAGTLLVWRCRFSPLVPGTGGALRLAIGWIFTMALAGLARRGLGR